MLLEGRTQCDCQATCRHLFAAFGHGDAVGHDDKTHDASHFADAAAKAREQNARAGVMFRVTPALPAASRRRRDRIMATSRQTEPRMWRGGDAFTIVVLSPVSPSNQVVMSQMLSPGVAEPPAKAVAVSGQIALFLDFDGTLVEIAPSPEDVRIDRRLPEALDALRQRLGGALALVSGRPVALLDKMMAPYRFDAAGLHGAQIRLGSEDAPVAAPAEALHAALRAMVRFANSNVGVIIEDKRQSIALHWRLAPALADEALALMEGLAAEIGPTMRLQRGKAVAELVPASASKGGAITWLMQQDAYAGRTPVFVGDDVTDEDGFAAVNAASGLSIRIGDGQTCARHRLASPTALRQVLLAAADGGDLTLETFLQN
ncbi:trehalose-phosphatase [Bosea sp. CCNWLW174]